MIAMQNLFRDAAFLRHLLCVSAKCFGDAPSHVTQVPLNISYKLIGLLNWT